MRRISVVVVSVLLMVVLAATMAALPTFAENGNSGTNDGFGTAASQIATNNNGSKDDGSNGGGLGEHSRDPDGDGKKGGKREGIGNVAKNDGDSVGEHGCKQLAAMGGDCSKGPGKGK